MNDELVHQLNTKANEICRGDYSRIDELYPYIVTGQAGNAIGEFTENFVLMATELEAREFDLNRKIDELKEKNHALVELECQRTEGSVVFFSLLSIISLFTFVIEILRAINPNEGFVKFIVFRGTDLLFILTAVFFIFFTRLPLRRFGLTLDNWKKSLVESIVVTGVLILVMLAIKYFAIKNGLMDGSNGLVNFRIIDWTFLVYLVIATLQEFLARGVCLTSIERNITGKYAAPAVIILSALVFGLPHLTFSLGFAVWGLVGGVIWGILYMRHRTIIGVSISHYVIGTMAFLCGFIG
ncbi:MAG: CPBP family intramembrane glutamic endopeptidase [Bacteroidales bacterium]